MDQEHPQKMKMKMKPEVYGLTNQQQLKNLEAIQ